jgi:hypothetical protein
VTCQTRKPKVMTLRPGMSLFTLLLIRVMIQLAGRSHPSPKPAILENEDALVEAV